MILTIKIIITALCLSFIISMFESEKLPWQFQWGEAIRAACFILLLLWLAVALWTRAGKCI
jgi:Na+/melibiose symporter-like transporter